MFYPLENDWIYSTAEVCQSKEGLIYVRTQFHSHANIRISVCTFIFDTLFKVVFRYLDYYLSPRQQNCVYN